MGYVAVGLLVLAAVAYAAVNVAYYAFSAAMTVVNVVHGEPVVYLHGRILREAEAGTTIRYEVVRLPDASAYADRFVVYRVEFEARNASRWPVTAIAPDCTLAFGDGSSTHLTVEDRAERTSLDNSGRVSTAVPPGGALRVSLRTEAVQQFSPVLRAACRFDLSVPWWIWAVDAPLEPRP